jgi:acetyltransferase-like isoleucine patch superfamily enzyme
MRQGKDPVQCRGRLGGSALQRQLRALWQGAYIRWAIRGKVVHGVNLRLGQGSIVWSANGLSIGHDVSIGRNCTIEVDGVIGDYCLLSTGVGIIGRDDHDVHELGVPVRDSTWIADRQPQGRDRVEIGQDVFIGFGSIILSGVKIGDCAIVAAGSVVVDDVGRFDIVAGQPARKVGERFPKNEGLAHLNALAARPGR